MDAILPRMLVRRIQWLLSFNPGVVLTGARRVGKTVAAESIAAGQPSLHLDLQQEEDRLQLAGNAANFLTRHPGKLIIIDEVQRMPGLFDHLRVAIDYERKQGMRGGKFLLLGSVAGKLLRQTSEHLTGRMSEVRMHGLNRLETRAQCDEQTLWERGMFPESLLAPNDKASLDWRTDYLGMQVQRELTASESQMSSDNINAVLARLALQQGTPVNVSSLGGDLGLTRESVAAYLRALEEMMLIRKLPAFVAEVGIRHSKRPKYYYCDSGLLHAAAKVSLPDLMDEKNSTLRGTSWEGFAIENLASVMPSSWSIAYYRDRKGNEIDLVVVLPGWKIWAIEIKSSPEASMSKRNYNALDALKPERAFLVHRGRSGGTLGHMVQVMSLADMMSEIAVHGEAPSAAAPHGGLDTARSRTYHDLVLAINGGDPSIPLHRKKHLSLMRDAIDDVIRENVRLGESNARLLWSQARDRILEPYAMESDRGDFAPERNSFFRSVRRILSHMLRLKPVGSGSADQNQISFAGLCAYDLFVSLIGDLLFNAQYETIRILLAGKYACRGKLVSSHAFWIDARSASWQAARHFLVQSSEARSSQFVDAELVIMLHSLLEADRQHSAEAVWCPYAAWHAPTAEEDFFLETGTAEGLANLLASIGAANANQLQKGLKQHSERLLPTDLSRQTTLYSQLLTRMHTANWGSST